MRAEAASLVTESQAWKTPCREMITPAIALALAVKDDGDGLSGKLPEGGEERPQLSIPGWFWRPAMYRLMKWS